MKGDGGEEGRLARARRVMARTFRAWDEDGALQWGAAIAYYSVISLAPLVILAVTVIGSLFGSGAGEAQVVAQVELLAGPRGAEIARSVLEEAGRPEFGSLSAMLTVGILLFGATAVFANLQSSLNRIWSVRPRTGVVRNLLRTRIAAVVVVLSLGGLMLVSVVAGALVAWFGPLLAPLEAVLPLVRVVDLLTSLLLLWLFVGTVYWVLPDVRISWRDVWMGALVTAFLLVVGKHLLAAFLAQNALVSLYGTAGSLLLLLLWVYYSALVFFLGAEFTQVWAEERGRPIVPKSYAVRVTRRTEEPEPKGE